METEDLSNRWHELLQQRVNADSSSAWEIRRLLQERVTILHRLNELGEYMIDGVPIMEALEETNVLLRKIDWPLSAELHAIS